MSFNTDKFQESDLANPWVRLGAYMIDVVLLFVTLFIGWIIWAFILLGRAQTPGHQLLKMRYIDLSTGKKASFGKMVLMIMVEIGLSIILAPFSAGVTNLLWIGFMATMFFTTYRQQVTDMMVNVTVVKDPDDRFARD